MSVHHCFKSSATPEARGLTLSTIRYLIAGCMLALPWCSLDLKRCLAQQDAVEIFHARIEPILANYCYDCHGYGMTEGSVALDQFTSGQDALDNRQLWYRAVNMLQARLMPPADHAQPGEEELAQILQWIKLHVFEIDLHNPDPGRVTLRRLNRVEYRNTVRDLLGVDYNTELHFPSDDAGHGFDNLGDVLTLSPLLLEKYIAAAKQIVAEAVAKSAQENAQHDLTPHETPEDATKRRAYARQLLGEFANRAFRRPVDEETLERLTELAENSYSQGDRTFDESIGEAMKAVLVSPRFLFRVEEVEPADAGNHPYLDQYSLASRLSYFLWSSMPDQTLFDLAEDHRLRQNLTGQIERMMADPRWSQFIKEFAGQWLHTRDIAFVQINELQVIKRDSKPKLEVSRIERRLREIRSKKREEWTDAEKSEFRKLREALDQAARRHKEVKLDGSLRRAMRRETELHFEHVFRNNRPLLELLDCDYAFLNEELARHYEIEGVEGSDMRRVELPADSPRGGVLTQGTILATTSNPNRTSPVKRGVFILENILGIPPAPPPPDIPTLEEQQRAEGAETLTLRQSLARHRSDPLCSSCHDRMDPLGLALENFNALGMWREQDRGQPIDASGTLITGESFAEISQLKQILVRHHRRDFYRSLTKKMLVFAIGRGLEYHDVHTIDTIVDQLEASGGKPSVLLTGIIESAPFQKRRRETPSEESSDADRISQVRSP